MFRIAWKSLKTEAEGHGEYILTKEQADAFLASVPKNRELRDLPIDHWVEEESVGPKEA